MFILEENSSFGPVQNLYMNVVRQVWNSVTRPFTVLENPETLTNARAWLLDCLLLDNLRAVTAVLALFVSFPDGVSHLSSVVRGWSI